MESRLEIKRISTLILDDQFCVELVGVQRDSKGAQKFLVPDGLGVVRWGHFELARGSSGGFQGPVDVAGESVLLNLAGSELNEKGN
jgi:hypothetical protein